MSMQGDTILAFRIVIGGNQKTALSTLLYNRNGKCRIRKSSGNRQQIAL